MTLRYGQQPPGSPAAQKLRVGPWLVLLGSVLLVASCLANGDDSGESPAGAPATPAAPQEQPCRTPAEKYTGAPGTCVEGGEHTQRPHRALQLRPPRPDAPVPEPAYGRIRRRPVLGGLINHFEPAA